MAKKESSQQASEQQEGKVDRIDNALQKFSDMLIARMEQMKESKWKKGWTDGRTAQFGLPQNLVGRPYTGSNAFLCQIHTTMEHYRMPVYLTIKQIRDAGGMIKKGEHSIPIFKWDLRIKDKDGKKLSESDYRNMTKEEQAECTVRPYLKVYNEWNIDQTNLEEVNKEKYDAILKRFKSEPIKDEVGMYKNEAFDNLLKEQSWVCPIEYEKFNESAFYSPKRDQIVVPSKKQFNISNTPEDVFKDGMEFYGTTIHEMAHSTGHESRLGRDGIVKIDQFGSDQYAKEELVAELTSALIGNAMGFDSRIRENNIAYLQNWIGSLKKDPKFLKSVMSDVNKSSKMVLEHIDEQRRKLGEKALLDGSLDGVEEKNKNEQQLQDLKEEDAKKEVIAKVWPSVNNKITMPSGDILTVDYNKEKDTLEVAYKTSEGEEKVHCTNYDHSQGINQNLGYVWEELSNMKQFQEKETKTEILSQGKDYFTSLMETITSTPNSEHTVLSVKTLPELRDYYKGNPNVGAWINQASNKEIIEAGADFLPNLRYSHKEGRSLYNIEAAYSNINALYPDVVDNDAKRQIVHRIKQAEEVVTSYHNNIEEKFGKEFLMEKENMNKVLSRNDYQEQGQTIQLDPKDEKKYFSSYNYFQMESETAEFDKLKDAENYEGILALAKEYDQGDSMDLEHVETSMTPDYGDDVLIDDENYAVVYNNSVGGTYNLLRKYSENDIREAIERYGMPKTPSYAVKFIDQQMGLEKGVKPLVEIPSPEAKAVAKSFREDLTPQFTMPNGKVLDYHYDASDNKVIVGEKLNDGSFIETYVHDYDFALSKAENMSAIYKELSTEYQAKKASEEKKTPREDSYIQTDVVGKAKQIASTGVPMEEAEKKASSIVKEEVHKEHHKQEAEKDKQEKDKANQAAAEEKKEQQEKKEESKEVSEATAKALTHAALLVGALSAAKQNEGIWMNKSQKGNAEFINTHTPITAYNNIMMNLNSDANKYKTNVYTYYNPAKENHMPVKQNEKGMEFHWTSWGYQNAMDKDEVITSKQFDKLPDDEKSFYTKHATRVMQNIYNVEQTTMNANNHDAYVEILKNKGAQLSQNEKEQKGKYSSIMKQWKELKGKHPDALLLFRIGDFYEMYKQDAKRGSEVLGITLTKMNESKDFHLAGFPHQALDTYLPKLIRAGERVAICDQLESKKTVSQSFDTKAILNKAYATAKEVAKQSGMQYERVMVLQDAKYDSKEDKIVVSGMKGEVGNEKMAALYKANDIYRAVVAATGTENRLDRSGRNNLLPEDDAKHEQLVRELAAGVMMARQGLPAILSKENEKLIPYWEREIKENPKLLGIVERDVNNAVETIDNLVAKRKVDYESIRGQLPGKTMEKPSKYSISQDLAKLPNIETKEIVVVKDILRKEADVILPAGASLEVNNEVPGMRKDRITIALKKEGIDDVRFYNAGGSLGLNKPNSYFQGKEVTLNNLKQYELVPHHTLDVEKQAAPKKEVIIKNFQAIKDDNGRYAFFIKPENEPSFSVYPAKEHLNTFYNVIKTDKQAIVHNALAQRYYEMATKHPDTKLDLITPKKVDVDMKLIERPSITSSAQDAKQKLIFATINGQRVQAPINKQQWQKMWLAEDMGAYKRALAAVIFEPMLKRGMEEEQSQQAVSKSEKVEIKEKPAPENKVQETVTETHRTGLHM
ncbi:ArdC family protein [Segatella copri]|uniref:ArdC family protein n=1 Tax=Segatella copri TaxID=165179 RepID=UPI00222E469D|nr:zincin-like metallopeptidase domain-containing protein [Segatella copri]MCW4145254.1 zincin-like metallopeptidase domain-containing protein [Segatella copri]